MINMMSSVAKIESYFLNDLPQHLVDTQIHRDIPRAYGQASRSRSAAINLGFGIDLD